MKHTDRPKRKVGERTRDNNGNVLRTGKASTFYLKHETKEDLDFIKDSTQESKGKIIDRLVEAEANRLED